ncbi:high affinity glucose transporter [Amniculicola lignicola CBS 123094]|uniref:High affinity glucose transporter n=1 Tax=Amniculicola lignicola CBS 123094 TaxID=1392246 RepID=A0A6A5WP48_9PLEO|nr:high affinity glucose transporter [Amniculicola lignicola CBS 123094]
MGEEDLGSRQQLEMLTLGGWKRKIAAAMVQHPNTPHLHSSPSGLTSQHVSGVQPEPPQWSLARRPANIPLHTLSSSARPRDADSAYLLDDHDKTSPRSSFDTASGESDFSLWSDTGDLVDQLADAEDPLRIRLRESVEGARPQKQRRQQKRARFHSQEDVREKAGRPGTIRKEDIEIPTPRHRTISAAEKLLAAIMAPRDGPSRIHGLHGKKLIYFTSVFVSLGVFLFGYDQGVMSGIITGNEFKNYFDQPTSAQVGTMVAILEIGAFISSLGVGKIGDMLGRRRTILYGSLIFIVGGALQAFANGMAMMMLGRIIAGLGVGTLSTIVPVYQSEISPPHNRGKLACIEFTGNITGYAASVWVDYFCTYIDNDWSWRLPLLMQCVMGSLLAGGSLLICESPRWLLDNDYDEEGIVVIANLYGKGDIHNPKAKDEYREIKMNVLLQRQEGERSYGDMFKRYRRRVFIAMSAQALAQLNGINVISYYAPLVFEEAGWFGRQAILMTGINAITYLLSTIPPWYVVDTLGRRKILLSGAVAMCLSLTMIAYFIDLRADWTPNMVVLFVMIYNAAFGASWGPIPWLYPPEILPLSIRAKGASLSTATNWAFNWLVGEMTPILQERIQWRLYLIHAFFCAVSFIIVWFLYPETANIRLEDMNSIFGDATSAMPTPQTLAEAESLFSGGRSPVPSLTLQSGRHADAAIPGLDIDPPDLATTKDGQPIRTEDGEGIGGWISNIVKRSKGNGEGDSLSGKYKRIGQDED